MKAVDPVGKETSDPSGRHGRSCVQSVGISHSATAEKVLGSGSPSDDSSSSSVSQSPFIIFL